MKNKFALSALSAVLLASAGAASAADVSSTFEVNLTVKQSCLISSTEAIQFGVYDPINAHASANLDAEGKVSVRCTAGSSNVKVSLDEGLSASASSSCAAPLRNVLSAENNLIGYELHTNSSRNSVWGCDASNEVTMPQFTSSLTPVDIVTYGRIPAGQLAPIGTYSDTVGITVTF